MRFLGTPSRTSSLTLAHSCTSYTPSSLARRQRKVRRWSESFEECSVFDRRGVFSIQAASTEWFMEADESVAVDSVLRVYVVAGTYFVYEIVLEVPEGQWPEMWPAYEGVIASFAAE